MRYSKEAVKRASQFLIRKYVFIKGAFRELMFDVLVSAFRYLTMKNQEIMINASKSV